MVNETLHQYLTEPLLAINREGKLILLNQQVAEIFGILPEKSKNKKIWEVIKDDNFNRAVFSLIKEQIHFSREYILLMPHNVIYKAQLIPVTNKDNRVVSSLVVFKDYSDIRKLEKDIQQTLTDISHKLRTPLTSIKGFIETLLAGSLQDKKVCREFLQIINEETNRMSKLVTNILNLTTFSARKKTMVIKPVNLSEIARQSVNLLKPLFKSNKIKIIFELDKHLPLILGDKNTLSQVFINLLDNAIKYSKQAKSKKIILRIKDTNAHLKIDIIDYGIGILPKELPFIFKEFYYSESPPADKLAGAGLGLTIAKKIIDSHHGKISVESKVNKGSQFSFILPKAYYKKKKESKKKRAVSKKTTKKKSVKKKITKRKIVKKRISREKSKKRRKPR